MFIRAKYGAMCFTNPREAAAAKEKQRAAASTTRTGGSTAAPAAQAASTTPVGPVIIEPPVLKDDDARKKALYELEQHAAEGDFPHNFWPTLLAAHMYDGKNLDKSDLQALFVWLEKHLHYSKQDIEKLYTRLWKGSVEFNTSVSPEMAQQGFVAVGKENIGKLAALYANPPRPTTPPVGGAGGPAAPAIAQGGSGDPGEIDPQTGDYKYPFLAVMQAKLPPLGPQSWGVYNSYVSSNSAPPLRNYGAPPMPQSQNPWDSFYGLLNTINTVGQAINGGVGYNPNSGQGAIASYGPYSASYGGYSPYGAQTTGRPVLDAAIALVSNFSNRGPVGGGGGYSTPPFNPYDRGYYT